MIPAEKSSSTPHKHLVEPGVALNLRDWGGRGGGATVVLIHGSADGGFVWEDIAQELIARCKVLSVDLRGHGDSDHDPDHHYTLAKHVQDVRKVLDDLQLQDVILMGHSLGGDIAGMIAPDLGNRLRALVVVDSGPGGDEDTAKFLQAQLRESHRPYANSREYAQWLQERRFLAKPAVLERIAAQSLALGADGLYRLKYDIAVLDMITTEHDDSWWIPSLSRTTAPTLIVRGMASAALSRQTAERICAAACRGRLVTVPAAGHAVMSDNPEGFAQAIMSFIVSSTVVTGAG